MIMPIAKLVLVSEVCFFDKPLINILAPYIENESDLRELLIALKTEVIDKLYIYEYF